MKKAVFPVTDIDRDVVKLYSDFLPKQVFDAHMHMHLGKTIPSFYDSNGVFCREMGTPDVYWTDMKAFLPGVETIRVNMMPMLDPVMTDLRNGLRNSANEHVFKLLLDYPENTGCPYILPTDSEETIGELVSKPGVRGLKCYCYGAGKPEVESLTVGDYLPESAWVVASKFKIPIILHIMRQEALSDPDNFAYVNKMAKRYPDAPLVLAHCARAFSAWTGIKKIRELEDRGNIWFDISAICEPGPMLACIIKNAGKRTMWGSDYPICMHRGRAVSIATGQNWLTGDALTCPKTRIVAENLLACYQTALLLDLDKTQIVDLFYKNAASLFGAE